MKSRNYKDFSRVIQNSILTEKLPATSELSRKRQSNDSRNGTALRNRAMRGTDWLAQKHARKSKKYRRSSNDACVGLDFSVVSLARIELTFRASEARVLRSEEHTS